MTSLADLRHDGLFVQLQKSTAANPVWPVTHEIQATQTYRYHK